MWHNPHARDSPCRSTAHSTSSLPMSSQEPKAFPRSKDHTPCKTHPELTRKANVLTEPRWVGFPQTLLNAKARHKTHMFKMSSWLLNLNKHWHSSEDDDISFTTSSIQVTMTRHAERQEAVTTLAGKSSQQRLSQDDPDVGFDKPSEQLLQRGSKNDGKIWLQ